MTLEFSWQCFKNTQIQNFIKIRPVEPSCCVRTDGRTDGHDEANSIFRIFEIWRRRIKTADTRTAAALCQSMERVLLEASSSQFEDVARPCRSHPNVQNSLTSVSILSQNNPLYAFNSYFCKIHLKRIVLSTSAFSKWSLSFNFPDKPL
jgi:hypothetical protein